MSVNALNIVMAKTTQGNKTITQVQRTYTGARDTVVTGLQDITFLKYGEIGSNLFNLARGASITYDLTNGNKIKFSRGSNPSYPFSYDIDVYPVSNGAWVHLMGVNMGQGQSGNMISIAGGFGVDSDGGGLVGFLCAVSERNVSLCMSYAMNPVVSTARQFFLNSVIDTPDPYGTNDNQTPEGGYGSYDYATETETPPALPSLSAANAGFITLWNPTISEIGSLADYLWGPSFSIASWQKLWNDPMQCLLSLGIVPVSPTTGTRRNIYFGNADTGIESTPITDQFVTADMGSMDIEGKTASYMDYSPYCKASIFLPYCGTYALDVDEIMDATLSLEYHIDIYTGACVAYLTVSNRKNSDGSTINNIMYQFTGNCLASIPVTSADHSQLLQSLLFMGASIAATVATAGAGAPIEGLAAEGEAAGASGAMAGITAGSAINTVMSMKPNVMHSGNLSSTAGLLGAQKPHVTFTWSNLCRPEEEYKLSGMPLQKSGTLSDFEGFTIVSACHMDNILCTDAERALIEQALGRGVII